MRHGNQLLPATLIGFASLIATTQANAARIFVDAAAAPGGSGTSWADARNDLREAMLSASSGDEIWVAAGLYVPTSGTDRYLNFNLPSGVKLYGGFAGVETDLNDRPTDPNPLLADPQFDTILSGEIGAPGFDDNTYNLLNIEYSSAATLVDRVVLTGGTAAPNYPYNRGGGARFWHARGTLSNSLLIDNAAAEGGAIWMENTNGFNIENCAFIKNRSTGGYGGAILHRFGSATLSNCFFKENQASITGGAISLSYAATISISQSRFESNSSSPGGGAISTSLNSTSLVEDCEFHGNKAARSPVGANGGAVYNNTGTHTYRRCSFTSNESQSAGAVADQSGSVSVYEDCAFIGNISDVSGGATWVTSASTRFSDCIFHMNESGVGGALSSNVPITVERCVFSENTTHAPANYGGAVHLAGNGALFTDCDFYDNHSNIAGAAYISGSGHVFDRCRFVGNSANASGGVLWHAGASVSYTNCLIAGNTSGFFASVLFMQSNSTATITNCTIVGNSGPYTAVYSTNSTATIKNTIMRNANAEFNDPASIIAAYSNIEGAHPGVGNIDADPLFADAPNGDYSLTSGSPCIDAGENTALPLLVTVDLLSQPRFRDDSSTPDSGLGSGPIVDMGAIEFQPPPACPGDANQDGVVTFPDITTVLASWGTSGPLGDANNDGSVSFPDITSVLANWNSTCP